MGKGQVILSSVLPSAKEYIISAYATDRLRPRDAKKREKRDVNNAWGKRGSKEREEASKSAHKSKKKYGKENDDNFGWQDLKDKNFNKIGMATRVLIGVGGVLLIGGTLVEDVLTSGAGIANDGVTISDGVSMVVRAFTN
ncbi:hypothetical protein [Oxobacter pfennigii]|uniref:hypothetical protein n=1 Tax=Oxobacter pfennigii TaxID=36849 RepID=UPI001364CEB6|nr:hypothetical protein [Oxobacter pfennigii]